MGLCPALALLSGFSLIDMIASSGASTLIGILGSGIVRSNSFARRVDAVEALTGRALRFRTAFALGLLTAVAACGPSQAEIDAQKAKEAAAQVAQRQALAKAADDRKRTACEGAIQVARSFLGSARSIQSAVEAAHSPAVEKARLGYQRTIGNEIYAMSAVGVGAAIDLKNAYVNARIQNLKEQQAVLESFTPLEKAFNDYAQATRVAAAGGAAFETADICKHSQELIRKSKETLVRLSKSTKSVERDIEANRQVIEAAEKRLSDALI